jgi:hypothetical protein
MRTSSHDHQVSGLSSRTHLAAVLALTPGRVFAVPVAAGGRHLEFGRKKLVDTVTALVAKNGVVTSQAGPRRIAAGRTA